MFTSTKKQKRIPSARFVRLTLTHYKVYQI